jgi:hypothetical protein
MRKMGRKHLRSTSNVGHFDSEISTSLAMDQSESPTQKAGAYAPAFCVPRAVQEILKVEFCADLDSARHVSAGHLSKVSVAQDGVDAAEVRVVERVEVLPA